MSFSASGGPATSGSSSNAGVSNPVSTPFVFDNSGFNVNIHGTGDQSAQGSTDANAGAGASSALSNTNWLMMAAGAVVVWLVARNA